MNGQCYQNPSKEDSSLRQWVVDSLSVNTRNKQSISQNSKCAQNNDGFGHGSKLWAIEPPLDEQKDHEVNKKGVHHANSENDGVRVLKSCINDSRIFFVNAVPLNINKKVTQMNNEPRVRAVDSQMRLLTLIPPIN